MPSFIGGRDDARGKSFNGQARGGLQSERGKARGGKLGGKLGQRQPLGGKEALAGDRTSIADEIVRSGPGGRENQRGSVLLEEVESVGVKLSGGVGVD